MHASSVTQNMHASACIEYCPIEACMFWVTDEDHPPFGRIEVDPYLCIGCQKCTSKGPDGAFLDGCPWDAIEMIPTEDWEMMHGISLPDAPPPPPGFHAESVAEISEV